jgi:dienelactone hydrolase
MKIPTMSPLLVCLALAACAEGRAKELEVETEVVEYRHGEAVLEGYLARPAKVEGKLPGILIVHAWKGIGDHERESARSLARDGYVAFALDMYGKGIRPKTRAEAARQAGIYRSDRALMRARTKAGLEVLAGRAEVDSKRIGAIGYCFGGGTVLELMRSGADVRGVVSFHGNLDTPKREDAKAAKAKVLVLHGAADPHVPAEQVSAFVREMETAKVDWQLVMYGRAVHSFTNPAAGNDPSRGAAYDERAAKRSWAAMHAFFEEILE